MTSIDPPVDEIASSPSVPSNKYRRYCVLGPNGPHPIRDSNVRQVTSEFLKDLLAIHPNVKVVAGDWMCGKHASLVRKQSAVRKHNNAHEVPISSVNCAVTAQLISVFPI
jgi:hypothetical protein